MNPVVEQCAGCGRINGDGTCSVYEFPEAKWGRGNCPMNTHLRKTAKKEERTRVGQQKQAKHRKKK